MNAFTKYFNKPKSDNYGLKHVDNYGLKHVTF